MNHTQAGAPTPVSVIDAAGAGLSSVDLACHLVDTIECRLFGHHPKPGELAGGTDTAPPAHLEWSVRALADRADQLNGRLRGILDRL